MISLHFLRTAAFRFLALALAGLGLALASGTPVHAAVCTWVGNTNFFWATTANWSDTDNGPLSGDSLLFGVAGSSGTALNNNLTNSSFRIATITFSSGAAAFVISGTAFTLTGGITNSSTSLETINDAISLTGTQAFFTNVGGGNVKLGGVISGTGAINAPGPGVLTLGSSLNTYSGSTTVGGGTLSVGSIVVSPSSSGLGNASSPVTLIGGDLSYTGSTATYTRGFTIIGGGEFDVLNGTVTITSSLALTSGSMTFGGAGNTTLSTGFAVPLGGSNTLTKIGAGNLTLSSSNSSVQPTTAMPIQISAGTLTQNIASISSFVNPLGTGQITIAPGASLVLNNATNGMGSGDSYINPISISNASSGTATLQDSSGSLTFNSFISFAAGGNTPTLQLVNKATLPLQLNGGISGTGNLALNSSVSGQINLSGGTVNNTGTVANFGTGTSVLGLIASNATGVIENGASSTLVLSAPAGNTYSGGTTLNLGTIIVSNAAGSATGFGTVTLNGGTLGAGAGGGTITGPVQAGSGPHTIAPGAGLSVGFGTLNLVGGLATNGSTTLDFNLGSPVSGGAYIGDLITIGSGGLSVGASTTISFGTNPSSIGDYRLIGGNIGSPPLANFLLPVAPAHDFYSLSTAVDPGYLDLVVSPTFSSTSFSLSASLIPPRIMVNQSTMFSGSISNTGSAGADSLDYALGVSAPSGSFSALSNSSGTGLAPGATSPSSTATYTAGAVPGPVTLNLSATATNTNLGGPASGTSPIGVMLDVLTQRTVTASPADIGVQHTGANLGLVGGTTTLSSTGSNNSFTSVTVGATTFNGITTSGTAAVSGSLNPVATSGTLTTLPVTTAENGGLGLPGEGSYAPVIVPYIAELTSGNAVWTGTAGGSWDNQASANWTDSGGTVHAAPGTFPGFANTDTATFNGSGSVTAIDLTGVNPSLNALNFSNSSYALSNGNLTLNGNSGTATVTVTSGTQTINSPMSLASNTNFAINGGALLVNSAIGGSGGLTKTGSGTATLAAANTYTGPTTVQGGLLVLQGNTQSSPLTAASGGTLQLAGNTVNLLFGSLTAQAGGAVEYNGATINGGFLRGPGAHVILPGGTSNFNGVTTFNSTAIQQNGPANFNNFTNGGQLANNAAMTWNGGANASSGQVNVNAACNVQDFTNNGVVTVNSGGTLNNSVSDIVFGGGSRTTINAGGQLNANSDASGSALDLNGALLVNNGTVTGTTNVYFGSLAQGSGTYGSVNVYNGGQFKPGNSPGSVTTGPATWNSGGQYLVELNDATGTAGTNWNLWNINGSLGLDAGTTPNSKFTLVLQSGSDEDPGLAADFNDATDYQWLIAEASGDVGGFNPAEFAINTTGFANNFDGGQFGVAQEGNQVYLTFTVPEPSTIVLLGVGVLGLLAGARRKQRTHHAPRDE